MTRWNSGDPGICGVVVFCVQETVAIQETRDRQNQDHPLHHVLHFVAHVTAIFGVASVMPSSNMAILLKFADSRRGARPQIPSRACVGFGTDPITHCSNLVLGSLADIDKRGGATRCGFDSTHGVVCAKS